MPCSTLLQGSLPYSHFILSVSVPHHGLSRAWALVQKHINDYQTLVRGYEYSWWMSAREHYFQNVQ